MAYQHSIIKEIRQKTSSGDFGSPTNIGAEQRFVSALLNSHNNNLEEQNILGSDCVTITWQDDEENIQYVTKKFYNGDLSSVSNKGYYILFATYYDKKEFYFENKTLFLPEYEISKAAFRQIDDNLVLRGEDSDIYSINNVTNMVEINPSFKTIKEEVLCLRTDISDTSDIQSNSDILISEKKTIYKNENGKTYIIESIINHLS